MNGKESRRSAPKKNDDGSAMTKEDITTQNTEESAEDPEELKAIKYFKSTTMANFLDKDHGA